MYNMDDLVLRSWVGHGHLLRWNREFLGYHIYIKSNESRRLIWGSHVHGVTIAHPDAGCFPGKKTNAVL